MDSDIFVQLHVPDADVNAADAAQTIVDTLDIPGLTVATAPPAVADVVDAQDVDDRDELQRTLDAYAAKFGYPLEVYVTAEADSTDAAQEVVDRLAAYKNVAVSEAALDDTGFPVPLGGRWVP